MRVGSLVKHIEYEHIGVVIKQGLDRWLVHYNNGISRFWCSQCELEVICE